MKKIQNIIKSSNPPAKDALWIDGKSIKTLNNGKWESINDEKGDVENVEKEVKELNTKVDALDSSKLDKANIDNDDISYLEDHVPSSKIISDYLELSITGFNLDKQEHVRFLESADPGFIFHTTDGRLLMKPYPDMAKPLSALSDDNYIEYSAYASFSTGNEFTIFDTTNAEDVYVPAQCTDAFILYSERKMNDLPIENSNLIMPNYYYVLPIDNYFLKKDKHEIAIVPSGSLILDPSKLERSLKVLSDYIYNHEKKVNTSKIEASDFVDNRFTIPNVDTVWSLVYSAAPFGIKDKHGSKDLAVKMVHHDGSDDNVYLWGGDIGDVAEFYYAGDTKNTIELVCFYGNTAETFFGLYQQFNILCTSLAAYPAPLTTMFDYMDYAVNRYIPTEATSDDITEILNS